MFEKRHVEGVDIMLVHQHMHDRVQKGRIGFRLDRQPFGRTGAGHRKMGFDLDPFHAALARRRVAATRRRPPPRLRDWHPGKLHNRSAACPRRR